MRRLAHITGVVLATALLAAVAAGPASAKVPKNFYGIVPNASLDASDFARMQLAGVGSFRFSLLWAYIQTSPGGPIDWRVSDDIVANAAANHIKLLPTILGTPPFVVGGCNTRLCVSHIAIDNSFQRAALKSFLVAAVQRYGPNGSFWTQVRPDLPRDPITRWQFWNEQNNPNEENPPKLYANALKVVDKAIHSVDRKAKVISGGMFGMPPKKGKTAWGYLNKLFANGAGKVLDGVAIHPYAPDIKGLKFQIEKIRGVLKKRHKGGLKTYVTEIGWGSSKKRFPGTGSRGQVFNVGVKKQKENLNKSFNLLTSNRKKWKIGGVYWFTWKDPFNPPPGLCAFCYSSGLYESDSSTPKPALQAYEKFTRKTKRG